MATAALESHPAANLFPLLTGKEYESFKADIAANGLLQDIWLCDGKILDGRNRYRACTEVGIEPRFTTYNGSSPVAFAWSLNGKRRHLTKSQLAGIAADMLPALQAEARTRQLSTLKRGDHDPVPLNLEERGIAGDAASKAAEIVGVDKSYVYAANRVKKVSPDLHEDVKAGKISVDKATKIVTGKRAPSNTKTKPPRSRPSAERAEQIRPLAAAGYLSSQIAKKINLGEGRIREIAKQYGIPLADAIVGNMRKNIDVRRVVGAVVYSLEGYATDLDDLNLTGLNASDAAAWANSLRGSLRTLERLRKRLLEASK